MNYALSAASCVLRIWHSIKHKESVEDLFVCLSSLRLARDLFHNKQPTPYALPIYLYPLARGGIYASTRSVSAVRDLWIKFWRISKKSQRTKRFRFVLAGNPRLCRLESQPLRVEKDSSSLRHKVTNKFQITQINCQNLTRRLTLWHGEIKRTKVHTKSHAKAWRDYDTR